MGQTLREETLERIAFSRKYRLGRKNMLAENMDESLETGKDNCVEESPHFKTNCWVFCRYWAKRFLGWNMLVRGHKVQIVDYVLGVVILLNAFCIGLEVDSSLWEMNNPNEVASSNHVYRTLETLFMIVYCMEILLRFLAGGFTVLHDKLVLFDIFLVVLGIISEILSSVDWDSETVDTLQVVIILRVCRLMRLLRTVRMMPFLGRLWKFVVALFSSSTDMLSTIVILVFVIYIASCFAVEMIAKDPLLRNTPETKEIIDTYFNSLGKVMLAFVQFVTMDSLSAIYFPLIEMRGHLCIFFFFLIVVVSVALMNIVTANLVEVAIASSIQDKEMQDERLRQMWPNIIKAFEVMDVNDDGSISRSEVIKSYESLPPSIARAMPQDKMVEVFELFDSDNSGTVCRDEFVDGFTLLAVDGHSMSDLRLLALMMQVKIGQELQLNELSYIRSRMKHADKRHKKETVLLSGSQPGKDKDKEADLLIEIEKNAENVIVVPMENSTEK